MLALAYRQNHLLAAGSYRGRRRACVGFDAPRRGANGHAECPCLCPRYELKAKCRLSAFPGKALVFRPHEVLAVDAFEPANREMASGHLLEMLDERVVH